MHVLSNATKIHKSLFSLYAAIRFFRHHGLPRVRMHKFIVNYHLFSCERFFLCRTAPRAFRFAVKIYHAFSSFETRRRLWRLESVRSFPLNCRVAFRPSVLNFHVRASIVCRHRSLKRPLRKTAPLCTLRVTSQKCSHCFCQLDCCRKRDSNTLLQSSWQNHPAR